VDKIDVSALPEPVARAIEGIVQAFRQQLAPAGPKGTAKELPRWDGQVMGDLTREEIYGDAT
jgi:hypothetical protein